MILEKLGELIQKGPLNVKQKYVFHFLYIV